MGDLREQPLEAIFNSDEMRRLRRAHAQGRAAEIDMCARCSTPLPHPLLVAASLLVHGKWVRRAMPTVERLIYSRKLPRTLLTPAGGELVQIEPGKAQPAIPRYDGRRTDVPSPARGDLAESRGGFF